MKHVLAILLLLTSFGLIAQDVNISGKVTNEQGEALIGATLQAKGTSIGTATDIDGKFRLAIPSETTSLIFSYTGYGDQEIEVDGRSEFNVIMVQASNLLTSVVVTGIKGADMRALATKKLASSVVEAISAQDLGNFSDENLGDALRRVPGVQVQEDQSGGQDGGARISVRGIGPAFVQVTVNGRQPISGGVQGIERFRQFNLGILPPEIVQGALVYKTSEAGLVEPGLGGAVDFQTIKPLSARYKEDRNFFGAVNLRGELDGQDRDQFWSPTPRLSAILGGKTKDNKLGAYASVLISKNKRDRDQVFGRIASRNLREDTNGNGVWDPDNGDTQFNGVLVTNNNTNNPILEEQERTALAAAIEWQPTKSLNIIVDGQYSKFNIRSYRALMRPNPGNNINLGVIPTNKVFAPGNLNIVDGFLQSFNTAGAFNSANGASAEGTSIFYQNQTFDNLNDNWVGGANATWKKNGWKISADYSLSGVEFIQELTVFGRSSLGANIPVPGPYTYENGSFPGFTFPAAAQEEFNSVLAAGLAAPVVHWNRFSNGTNQAVRLDFSREINNKLSIDFGGRWSDTDLFVASITRNAAALNAIFAADGSPASVPGSQVFGAGINNFLPGSDFNLLSSWPTIDMDAYRQLYPAVFDKSLQGSHPLQAGDVDIFDVFDIINQSLADDTGRGFGIFGSQPLFNYAEQTLAFYGQLNFDIKLGKVPVSGNLGLRAVETEYTGRAFTSISLTDPDDEVGGPINLSNTRATVNNAQWDFLPSLNLKFALKPNLTYRFATVRTLTRPSVRDLIPGGTLTAVNNLNSSFDGTQGSATLPNLGLKPYSTWQIDNTLEWYNEIGSAVIFSVYYKRIADYIARNTFDLVPYDEVIADGGYDTDAIAAAGVAEDFQNTRYTVTQPVNIGNATVFGFEVGFIQSLDVFAYALKGFGLQANYNYVTASFDTDEINIDDAFPGTSKHNVNSVLYYENAKFGIRAAYSYRSDFLRTLPGQGVTALGTYTQARSQIDLRANYNITKNVQFSIAAQNITGADQRGFYRNNRDEAFQLISVEPIYTVGLRYGF